MSLIPGIAPLSSVLAYKIGGSQSKQQSSLVQSLYQGKEKSSSSKQLFLKFIQDEPNNGLIKPKSNRLSLLV